MTIQGAPQAVVPLEWCPPNLLFIAFLLYIGVVPWVNDHMTTPSQRPCLNGSDVSHLAGNNFIYSEEYLGFDYERQMGKYSLPL